MLSREELQYKLEAILGSTSVFFQPPNNTMITYPAIIYERMVRQPMFADDKQWLNRDSYKISLVEKTPDSEVSKRLSSELNCVMKARYTANNLYHVVYNLNF